MLSRFRRIFAYLLGEMGARSARRCPFLEHAVERITSEPADFFGIQRRASAPLNPGLPPDITIFDYDPSSSASAPASERGSCRAASRRLVMPAEGIEY